MNPYYTVMESRHRWSILAAVSFTAASLGAIVMLAWDWPHALIRLWFYVGFGLTVTFLFQAARTWWEEISDSLAEPSKTGPVADEETFSPSPQSNRPQSE